MNFLIAYLNKLRFLGYNLYMRWIQAAEIHAIHPLKMKAYVWEEDDGHGDDITQQPYSRNSYLRFVRTLPDLTEAFDD
jgi:hypothetical protein